jgi:hypothetical protein
MIFAKNKVNHLNKNTMKNLKFIFILPLFLMLFATCTDGKTEDVLNLNEDDYYDFESFGLKEYDIPATIMLPGETANIGVATAPEVDHKPNHHKWRIAAGQNFNFEIDDWGNEKDMVGFTKKQLAENKMFNIKYIVDEKDFIYFEKTLKVDGKKNASDKVGVLHKTYLVYAQHIIHGVTYLFKSRDEGDSKVIAEFIAKSLKSVKSSK